MSHPRRTESSKRFSHKCYYAFPKFIYYSYSLCPSQGFSEQQCSQYDSVTYIHTYVHTYTHTMLASKYSSLPGTLMSDKLMALFKAAIKRYKGQSESKVFCFYFTLSTSRTTLYNLLHIGASKGNDFLQLPHMLDTR
jgi:hypothetical protein